MCANAQTVQLQLRIVQQSDRNKVPHVHIGVAATQADTTGTGNRNVDKSSDCLVSSKMRAAYVEAPQTEY